MKVYFSSCFSGNIQQHFQCYSSYIMNRSLVKSLIVVALAAFIAAIAFYVVNERDKRITRGFDQYPNSMDSSAMYFTDHEIRVAQKFSDSTLPQLKKLGLIVTFQQHELETVVSVSGKVWKRRSLFFKENFLMQFKIHNKVKGYPAAIRILDEKTGRLFAQVSASEVKEIYE